MKTHPFAVISLVCGLASLLLFCFTAVPGIIFGALALSKIRAEPAVYTGRNMGLWGIVINCLSLFGLGLILPNLILVIVNAL
jgi:hypothetical protein